jgi:hypothetical protein
MSTTNMLNGAQVIVDHLNGLSDAARPKRSARPM